MPLNATPPGAPSITTNSTNATNATNSPQPTAPGASSSATPSDATPAPVPGSPGKAVHLAIGSMSANGLVVENLDCQLDAAPLLAAPEIVAGIAKQKAALDACSANESAPRVTWTFAGGAVRDVKVAGSASKAEEACVAAAMSRASSTTSGACAATLHLGKKK
jgi:hypothetical protein